MSLYDLVSTASCAACTTTSSGDGTVIDNDTLSTSIVTSASYLTTGGPRDIVLMDRTNNYMNSISIKELEEFGKALDEELELYFAEQNASEQVQEQPKVYVKENKGQ